VNVVIEHDKFFTLLVIPGEIAVGVALACWRGVGSLCRNSRGFHGSAIDLGAMASNIGHSVSTGCAAQ
jgi:hypothetical protein